MHFRTGGIIPNVAQELHQQHIENVTKRALDKSGMSIAVCSIMCTYNV